MSDLRVPWSGRGHMYTEEEIQVVAEVMRTGVTLTQSKYQEEFEQTFAKKFNFTGDVFAVNSCASALELTAELNKIKPGDEVIIPAHTFAVTAIPYARRGAKIVWADIDPKTFLLDVKDFEKKITAKTKVVIPVHLYGGVCDMNPLMEIANAKGIVVVEDAAQAIGAKYDGRYAGGFGDFSCYSFHSAKNMSTLGEGGALVAKDKSLKPVIKGFRHNGMRAFPVDREQYWKPCMTNVDFDWDNHWPYNYCMGEVQCAVGTKLLNRLDSINQFRKTRHDKLRHELKSFEQIQFQHIPSNVEPAYHLIPARLPNEAYRDKFIQKIHDTYKVRAIVQYYPLYRYPMFQKAGFGDGSSCPEVNKFFDSMVSLPFHDFMTDEQFDYMVDSVKSVLKEL